MKNEVWSEGMNATANVEGNQVVPVKVVRVELGMVATSAGGRADNMASTGL